MNAYERCAALAEHWSRQELRQGTPHTAAILERLADRFRHWGMGNESPAAAVARYVLEHPEDRVGIMVFMDRLQEWIDEYVYPASARQVDTGRQSL